MRHTLVMLSLVVLHPVTALAQAALDAQARQEIAAILQKPRQVYEVDPAKNAAVFDRIDAQFAKHVDSSKATVKEGQPGISRYKRLTEKNEPIFTGEGGAQGVTPPGAFYTRYEKGLQRRVFRKEISVPGSQALEDRAAIALADGFIRKNALCLESELDTMADPTVASLRRRGLDSEAKPVAKATILQRVEFKRKVDGLEVINSKQAVALHPTTREVLGYESLNWTPVNVRSGKQYPSLSLQEAVARIESLLARSSAKSRITRVRAAMFQEDRYVFPVLVVSVESPKTDSTEYASRENLVIALAKELPTKKKTKPIRNEPGSIK